MTTSLRDIDPAAFAQYMQTKYGAPARKALGLPRIDLTPEERARAFGDPALAQRDPHEHDRALVERMQQGLPLSHHDRARARRFIRSTQHD